jgi:nitroreductase
MMNETLRNIQKRRSCRVFSEKQITEDELKAILQAGLYAPSAHNEQSWYFTVIQRQEVLDRLNDDFKEAVKDAEDESLKQAAKEIPHIFYNAPTVIIISGDQKAMIPQVDCAAATENMLIAAESLNIGSCWIGLAYWVLNSNKAEDYKKELCIPDNFKPYQAISLGYKLTETVQIPERTLEKVNFIK